MRDTARAAVAIVVLASASAHAQMQGLADLSIQDLMNIEVTSVSRKTQEVVRTAAAVYVITRDDIRRSGATSLPDVLRMAPGFSVAELSANTWSVTSRGFGGVRANKLLVLIDGRSIYTPLNGGVSWEMQLLPLDSIEQIEVIRGPGGSLWGANAINGVINIITKPADQAKGGRLETHVGRYEPGTVGFSYGGQLGETGNYVTRARYVQRGVPGLTSGFSHGDDLEAFYGRTRLDWGSGTDEFSVQGDLTNGEVRQVRPTISLTPPFRGTAPGTNAFTAGTGNFSWKHTNSSRAESSLQGYYSGFTRSDLREKFHTIDLDAKHHRALGDRHDVVFGGEYRFTESVVGGFPTVYLTPAHLDSHLVTTFLQDEIALTERVHVTGGVKIEHNQQTGFEIQPSARALWSVTAQQSLWGAVSRAVRTPHRFERGMHLIASAAPGPGGLPLVVTIFGSPDTTAETLTEYEIGYRLERRSYSVDLTSFVGRFTDLATTVRGTPGIAQEMGTTVFRIPLTATSSGVANTKGVEIAGTWKPARWWQVSSNYSYTDVEAKTRSNDVTTVLSAAVNGPVPHHQMHIRTFMDLSRRIEASALFYQSSKVPLIGIDGFKRLDLQMTWSSTRNFELVGGVRSLLHGATIEYVDSTARAVPTVVRPNPYAEIRWWF